MPSIEYDVAQIDVHNYLAADVARADVDGVLGTNVMDEEIVADVECVWGGKVVDEKAVPDVHMDEVDGYEVEKEVAHAEVDGYEVENEVACAEVDGNYVKNELAVAEVHGNGVENEVVVAEVHDNDMENEVADLDTQVPNVEKQVEADHDRAEVEAIVVDNVDMGDVARAEHVENEEAVEENQQVLDDLNEDVPDDSEEDDEEYRAARTKLKHFTSMLEMEEANGEEEDSDGEDTNSEDEEAEVDEQGDKEDEQGAEMDGERGQRARNQHEEVYFDSDEAISVETDSDENHETVVRSRNEKNKEYDPSLGICDFFLAQEFASVTVFREAVIKYSVHKRYGIVYKKNDKRRIHVKCKDPECKWMIYCSFEKSVGKYIIKTFYSKHTCRRIKKNKRFTSTMLADHYKLLITAAPRMKAKALMKLTYDQLKVRVSIHQCRKAKKIVFKNILASHIAEFKDIWRYVEELRLTNPGSTFEVQSFKPTPDANPHFKRFYVCFAALKKGFMSGCRKFIGLDGCFLKGVLKGELLTAVGRDGNNQIFPVAWAIVEGENNESWAWFLKLLRKDLKMVNGDGWTIISDQQKGLVNAVQEILPAANERMCVRHLYANWRKTWRGSELRYLYWGAAKSPNKCQMWDCLSDMAAISPDAFIQMKETLHPKYWCRAYFPEGVKCDSVDNNLCETFNAVLIEARTKSVLSLLEDIRIYVMNRLVEKRSVISKWKQDYAPRIHQKLTFNIQKSDDWDLEYNGEDGYEVTLGETKFVVYLGNQTCTCRRWMLKGYPCVHACAVIEHEKQDYSQYISEWFKKPLYKKTYGSMLQPVRGIQDWPTPAMTPLVPPVERRMPGRPKLGKRRREQGERRNNGQDPNFYKLSKVGLRLTCSECKKAGHNIKTCPVKAAKRKEAPTTTTPGPSQPQTQPQSQPTPVDGVHLPAEGAPRRSTKTRAPTGFGLFQDPNTGRAILNPGRASQQVVKDKRKNVRTKGIEIHEPNPNAAKEKQNNTMKKTSRKGKEKIWKP